MVASDCTTERRATAGERFLELTVAASTWVGGVWRSAQNRRSVAKLLDWDERMLRDIGLTRGDVSAVMALPAGQDPSYRLSELSGERRAAIRAEARERAGLVAPFRRNSRRPPSLPSRSYPFPYL
jgi:uncharacterized protein YjiS (DUF1127 family)